MIDGRELADTAREQSSLGDDIKSFRRQILELEEKLAMAELRLEQVTIRRRRLLAMVPS